MTFCFSILPGVPRCKGYVGKVRCGKETCSSLVKRTGRREKTVAEREMVVERPALLPTLVEKRME